MPPIPPAMPTPWQIQEWNHAIKKNLDWGLYTPTLSNTTNVAASTAYECQWSRIGDNIIVSGAIDVDPTAGTAATVVGISLPVPSKFVNNFNLSGTAKRFANDQVSGVMLADTTNSRASLYFYNDADASNTSWYFTFMYRIM